MIVLKKIFFKNGDGSEEVIDFGIPESEKEFFEMYKIRYDVYLKHDYIYGEDYPGGFEKDEYDDGRSVYFIAIIKDSVVGSARLIKDDVLPVKKDCFDFDDPERMKNISPSRIAEIGRLVSKKFEYKEGVFIPRHVVMLGLFYTIVSYSLQNNIVAGYAFIKKSLYGKFKKLSIPFYEIEKYHQKYNGRTLEKYFHKKESDVVPVYYFAEDLERYFEKVFNKKLFLYKIKDTLYFKKISLIDLFKLKFF